MLNANELNDLKAIIKKYVNLFKVLHYLDPAIAAEFKMKQEAFHQKQSNHHHKHNNEEEHINQGCCGSIFTESN